MCRWVSPKQKCRIPCCLEQGFGNAADGVESACIRMRIKTKMKRLVYWGYGLCVFCALFCLCFIAVNGRNEVYKKRPQESYSLLTEYEKIEVADASAPVGVREEYRIRLPEKVSGSLVFRTFHQSVEVWLDGELLYCVKPGGGSFQGRTPGNGYHTIPMEAEDAGKELKIVLIPVFESVRDVTPEFYLGSRLHICLLLMKGDLLALILSVTAVVTGLLLIGYRLHERKKQAKDISLFMLGLFSVLIGCWKFLDVPFFTLLMPWYPVSSYGTFLLLLLVCIPFVLFAKELYETRENRLWYLFCLADIGVILVTIVMQMSGGPELRQMLWLNHAAMGVVVVLILVMTIYESRDKGWNKQLKIMIGCLGACLGGMGIDIVHYYISGGGGSIVLAMVGFLAYIVVLGILSVKKATERMRIGMQAEYYEKMAFHDQLTGLYNRAAYMEYIGKKEFDPKGSIIVMLDLNNLKTCNDTLGHEKGDKYLLESARVIRHAFGDIGKCCRIGGDEFCILMKHVSMEECERRVQLLEELVLEYNQKNEQEFPIGIACGYAAFDGKEDYDLRDTLRRADRMMYRKKFRMKQKAAAG